MKLKILLLFAASMSSVIVLACSEVVFPTPLPTATPAPTATPITFPTPLPTATPFAVVFPTRLPTVTPVPTATPISVPSPVPTSKPSAIVFPTPLPTATPAPTATPISVPSPVPTATPLSVVFPTALPTATPAPTATPISLTNRYVSRSSPFASIHLAKVQPLFRKTSRYDIRIGGYGSGFAFKTKSDKCADYVCLLTAHHVVGSKSVEGDVYDATNRRRPQASDRLTGSPSDADPDLDIAVVRDVRRITEGLWPFAFAASGTPVLVGDPIRVVAIDFYEDGRGQWQADQMVLSGVISRSADDNDLFMIDAPLIKGNSGGVVLNVDMEVIGMVVAQLEYGYGHQVDGSGRLELRSRNFAVSVDAIRDKLCEWEYLTGSDCR